MKLLLASLALLLTVSSSRALDVVFTITGIALAGDPGETLGYDEGDIVTVQLVMHGGALGTAGGGGINWLEDDPSDPALWSDVTGTGLTGAYADPADPFSYVNANESGYFGFQASGEDIDDNIGLVSPNGTLLLCVCADLNTETIFAEPVGNQTAEEYFANYLGSITVDPGMELMMEGTGLDGGMAHFEVTSFTISMVPEPSTGVLMGLGLSGLLLRRRSR